MRGREYSRQYLIDALRSLAERLGRPPRQIDADKDPQTPVHQTYVHHFGSWLRALEAAGIRPGPRQAGYDCDTLLDYLRRLAEELGRTPVQKEMSVRKELPHATTYNARFGSWNAALRKAGLRPVYCADDPGE